MINALTSLILSFLVMAGQPDIYQTYSTSSFRIKYTRNISPEDIKMVGEILESKYADYKKKIGVALSHRVDVFVLNSVSHFRRESKSAVFNDGDFREGKIYLVSPRIIAKEKNLDFVLARVVARAVLEEVKMCPPWLSECYSLYAGDDLMTFGAPIRLNLSSFGDLSEEFSTAQRPKDLNEVYAKLAVTADFIITRYGEKKFEGLFAEFNFNPSVEEVFESYFGESISIIEKAWIMELRSSQKE